MQVQVFRIFSILSITNEKKKTNQRVFGLKLANLVQTICNQKWSHIENIQIEITSLILTILFNFRFILLTLFQNGSVLFTYINK